MDWLRTHYQIGLYGDMKLIPDLPAVGLSNAKVRRAIVDIQASRRVPGGNK
jgi:hypothetical protein